MSLKRFLQQQPTSAFTYWNQIAKLGLGQFTCIESSHVAWGLYCMIKTIVTIEWWKKLSRLGFWTPNVVYVQLAHLHLIFQYHHSPFHSCAVVVVVSQTTTKYLKLPISKLCFILIIPTSRYLCAATRIWQPLSTLTRQVSELFFWLLGKQLFARKENSIRARLELRVHFVCFQYQSQSVAKLRR